jgi:CelD/BcsL family acetyltransferase involved in cellulose biosynthesis
VSADWLGFEDFCRIEAAWNELERASDRPTPFATHAWIRTWWRHFGGDREFLALVVRAGRQVLAALPLVLRTTRFGGARLTVAEIIGTAAVPTRGMGLSDKADLLVRRDAGGAVERLVIEVLRLLDSVDLLHLKGLEEHGAALRALATSAAGRQHRAWSLVRSRSPYLALDGTWEDYLQSRGRRFRKNLRRAQRMLDERGAVELLRSADPRAPARVEDVLAISEESWTSHRGTDLFRHPAIRRFMLDVLGELAARGALDLHVLRVGGLPVAYELCFDVGGRVFAYNAGYRQDYARASPGNIVTLAVIESAFARGRSEYDMLRGTEAYKFRWSDTVRTERQLLIAADRLPARLYAALALCPLERLRQQGWLRELDDRASGLLNRLRFR